jgi:hypothetical protein
MPDVSPALPVAGQPNATEEPKIITALGQLVAAVNDVDSDQLQGALANALGVNSGATTRRGRNAPATTEITVTSATFVTHANDADITVTQPSLGVTLLIASVDGHGANGNGPQVGVRVDGVTNVPLGSFSGNSYSTLNTIVPQDRPGAHTYRFVYTVNTGTAFFATRSLCVVTLGF